MFTFPLDPEDLFRERATHMAKWGIGRRTIARVRARIRDSWTDAPGGWTFEWREEARRAEAERAWLPAAAMYGAARFPCACTAERREAQRKQIECYLRAAERFPCAFERRELAIDDGGRTVRVPTHVFSPRGRPSRALVLLSGGVDTYKVELHRLVLALVRAGGFTVAAIDMPGTGETQGPLAPSSHAVYEGVLQTLAAEARAPIRTAIVGLSFGGHWAAKLALRRTVDAAIDVGGPVGSAPLDRDFVLGLPNGMTGIVANALGYDAVPPPEETDAMLEAFSLRAQGLLRSGAPTSPLLVVNGVLDPYVPTEETTVFRDVPGAEVWLLRGADHCAANRFVRVVPALITWLRRQLLGARYGDRVLEAVSRALLPPRVAA